MPDIDSGGAWPYEAAKALRTSLQPNRSFEMPGGPLSDRLGTIQVKKLAEIERGGEGDAGFGDRR